MASGAGLNSRMRRFPCRAVARPAHPFGHPALLDRLRSPRMRWRHRLPVPHARPASQQGPSRSPRRAGPGSDLAPGEAGRLPPCRRDDLARTDCADARAYMGRSAQPHVAVSLDRPWAGGYLQPPRVRESPSPDRRASAGRLLPPVRTRGRGGRDQLCPEASANSIMVAVVVGPCGRRAALSTGRGCEPHAAMRRASFLCSR